MSDHITTTELPKAVAPCCVRKCPLRVQASIQKKTRINEIHLEIHGPQQVDTRALVLRVLNMHPSVLGKAVPTNGKSDAVRYVPEWQLNRWIMIHAMAPTATQHFFTVCTDSSLTAIEVVILYGISLNVTAS